MSRPLTINIPKTDAACERRTCQAMQIVEKNKSPVFNFVRETYPSIVDGVSFPRNERTHQRIYSEVANEKLTINDTEGKPVTVTLAALFEACASQHDAWAAEDGEVAD